MMQMILVAIGVGVCAVLLFLLLIEAGEVRHQLNDIHGELCRIHESLMDGHGKSAT